jgi:predicted Zn finger-like uncharacterized protein
VSQSKGESLMVIVCPECTTRFRVNTERIPAAGAKVRCARCKHVFKVSKPAEPPILETPQPVEQPVEEQIERSALSASEPPRADDFSFAAETAESETAEDFDYAKFRETNEQEPVEEETFTFSGDEPKADEQFTLADDQPSDKTQAVEEPAQASSGVAEQPPKSFRTIMTRLPKHSLRPMKSKR